MTTDRNSEGAVLTYGLRRRGTEEIIGVIPPKIHAIPSALEAFARDYEEVPLYSTPPATIPAAEVQALVERIEAVLEFVPDRGLPGIAKDELRRELAKLIPRNP